MLKREDFRIRDPFILTDFDNGCYYMYGTTDLAPNSLGAHNTFSVFKTTDLENFTEPKVIFDGDECDFWADRDFWAAEVHKYKGKYYLLGSVKAEGKCRTTQIFVCDTPDGKFVPVSGVVTPEGWECLDGTLIVEDGVPYMVFCHEWVQVGDGEIWALPLTDDLSAPAGEPVFLFRASDNPEVGNYVSKNKVTDGPFFYREGGELVMIWSSYANGRYMVLEAKSETGSVKGPYRHFGARYDFDGGHAMIFESLDKKRMISLHAPNKAGQERARFMEY